ncbi:hypothetical protein ACHAQJ_008853 [Trichoderma viride]
MAVRTLAATLFLAASALGRTDLVGCTYTDTVVIPSGLPGYDAYASRIWYVPGTGELCDFLDCGGGMAPPKTNVPGCPLYSGTSTYSPSYLDLQTKAAAAATAVVSGAASTTFAESQVTTKATTVPATTAPATTAPATTLVQSASDIVSETTETDIASAPTTAAPVTVSTSSPSSLSTVTASKGLTTGAPGRNGTSTGAHPSSTFTTNGAAPTAAAILGSCLIAGVAAAVGML